MLVIDPGAERLPHGRACYAPVPPPLSRTAADSFNVAFSYELIRYTVPQLIK